MQGFYPEFESGQVLTNAHLNQLSTWLNEQQQATRRKLLGIGIACGLEATRKGVRVQVGHGVALTSLGHLIIQDNDRDYGRYRPYTLPVSGDTDEDAETLSQEVPELLPEPAIPLWELLTDEAAPAPGEPPFQTLDAAFLAGKAVLLLLETRREALKNCDINDCSNKGARWVHTVRTLLLREEDAQALWEGETAGEAWPRPRGEDWRTLRAGLEAPSMPRLPLAAQGAGSLQEIHQLAAGQVQIGWQRLREQLERGFKTYGYLLRERFPDEAFPQGPWQGLDPLPPAQPGLADLLLDLHRYDLLRDALASWQEFLEAACCYEALCCPDPQRFPYHVLLGVPQGAPVAEAPGERRYEAIDFGIGAQAAPPALRHPFYPAPQLRLQAQHANAMLDLYYRTWLLFQRYRSEGLLESELRITPSRQQGTLSRKAIPYYLALKPGDDLHRNWYPQATRCGLLGLVRGYALPTPQGHPLAQVPDESDFYRVEGLLGRPLGQVLASLKTQQRQLGIGFGIEPVFLPVARISGDDQRNQLLALLLRNQTLQRLFTCKLRDLDVIFLLLLGFVFQVLVAVLYLLGRLNPAGATTANTGAAGTRWRINPAMLAVGNLDLDRSLNSADGRTLQTVMGNLGSNTLATFLQKQVREGRLPAMEVLDALDEPDDPNGQMALLYRKVQNQAGGDLLQRVRRVMVEQSGDQVAEPQVQQAYYSMRMLQGAESLLQQSAVNSVAQFDFDRFDSELTDLQSAWQGYRQVAAANNDNGAMQAALDSNMNLLANLGGSALLSNMRSEFSKRLKKIFSEFLFDGYNSRFPGLEHLCGVPKGGTLVLAYTHRSLLVERDKGMASVGSALGGLLVAQPAGTLAVADRAPLLRSERASPGGAGIAANTSASENLERAKAAVESATATRARLEAELAKREAALQADEKELAAARKQLSVSSKDLEKHQVQRDRLARNTAASAAEKRSATNAAKVAETQVRKDTEQYHALEKRAEAGRLQIEKASAALNDARRAEAQAQEEAKRAEAEARAEAKRAEEAARAAERESAADPAAAEAVADLALLRTERQASLAPNLDLSALLAADDPLNDLVVVADFCLPSYCCDSDCSDLFAAPEPEEPPREPPNRAITVNGRIVSAGTAAIRLPASQVLPDAKLQLRARDGSEIPVKMARGAFLFKVNPGSYTYIAAAKGHKTREETIDIKAPLGQDLIIALQRG